MLVAAKEMGVYGLKRQRKYDVFHLDYLEDFSPKWMVKVDGKTKNINKLVDGEVKKDKLEAKGKRLSRGKKRTPTKALKAKLGLEEAERLDVQLQDEVSDAKASDEVI